ncbi:MAG: aminotransferase class V-fold PLP-dependent enzyme [Clostridia bacterium]
MIYFDNAATTLIKPKKVYEQMNFLLKNCANAGRSGHKPSMKSSEVIFDTRQSICKLLNFDKPENVIFTYNATYALNLAIKSMIYEKCKVLTSSFEHNSTIRPLMAMENVEVVVVESPLYQSEEFIEKFEKSITEDVKFAVINHVSNVFGYILPVKQIDEICYKNGIKLILDASQSAGILDIDLQEFKSLVAICMPSHKSLYGVMGVGILVMVEQAQRSVIEGGTGSLSYSMYQPDFLPDMLESGTPNAPAIGSLKCGIEYVMQSENITNKLFNLARYIALELGKCSDTKVFFCDDINVQSGVISFYNEIIDNEELSMRFADVSICTRAGYHCSPLAHKSAKTDGTVRISFSTFNNFYEVEKFIDIYRKILKI